jgi:alkylation response protein AidB-like acyl-CoA dehydrogenase
MIDFSLSNEQRRFLHLTREFSSNEIRPVALQYDRDGTYPESILKKARELGLMYTKIPSAKCSIEAAAAKCLASDAAMKVTTDAVQIVAGTGYMKGAMVEKLVRDAKLTQIFEGTNQINRIASGREVLTGKGILF